MSWLQKLNAPFANDTKLGGAVNAPKVQEALQRDLGGLEHWAVINCMKFNRSNCEFLHLGQSSTVHRYKWGEDLGVLAE